MAETFDPYRKWLGILPQEQPAHYYRLLGIALFENDPDVIENAADRQMKHIRSFQTGPHAKESQALLNELAAAKVCLLQPDKKKEHDAQLRAKLKAKQPPAAPTTETPAPPPPTAVPLAAAASTAVPITGAPVAGAPMAAVPVAVPLTSAAAATPADAAKPAGAAPVAVRTRRSRGGSVTAATLKRRRKTSPVPLILGLGACVVVGLIVFFMVINGSGTPSGGDDPGSHATGPSNVPDPPDDKGGTRPPVGTDITPPVRPPSGNNTNPAGSNPSPETPDSQDIDATLKSARTALADRDYDEATRLASLLIERTDLTAEQAAQLADLRTVGEHLRPFYEAVKRGVNSLQPGDTFGDPDNPSRFLGKETSRRIQYERDGETKTTGYPYLRSSEIISLCRLGSKDDPAAGELAVCAFLLIDGKAREHLGDRADELARQSLLQAARLGKIDEPLARLVGMDRAELEKLVAEPGTGSDPDPIAGTPDKSPGDEPQPPAVLPADRPPVPAGEALLSARGELRRRYGTEIAALRTIEQKVALAEKLVGEAQADDNGDVCYVMLEKARDLSAESSRPDLVCQIVDQMAGRFQIDPLTDKAQYLSKCSATLPSEGTALLELAERHLQEARQQQRWSEADTLARVAIRAATIAKNDSAKASIENQARSITQLLDEQRKADRAAETLRQTPDDPLASYVVGRYRCFFAEDWEAGLPLLASGNDDACRQLAQQELAAPSDAADQLSLALGWIELAQKQSGLATENLLRRARHWLTTALPGLAGDMKARAEEEIRKIDAAISPATGDV